MARLTLFSTLLISSAGGVVAASFLEPGVAAAVPASSRSEDAILSPNDEGPYQPQMSLQQRTELTGLLAQVQQLRHDTAMSVINNIR